MVERSHTETVRVTEGPGTDVAVFGQYFCAPVVPDPGHAQSQARSGGTIGGTTVHNPAPRSGSTYSWAGASGTQHRPEPIFFFFFVTNDHIVVLFCM